MVEIRAGNSLVCELGPAIIINPVQSFMSPCSQLHVIVYVAVQIKGLVSGACSVVCVTSIQESGV